MLDRPSPAAIRNRRWRAERKAGRRLARIRVHARRLIAALRRSNPRTGELDSWPAVEAELVLVVEAFCEHWLGPAKKTDASRTAKR
jgi:hypothetical protein